MPRKFLQCIVELLELPSHLDACYAKYVRERIDRRIISVDKLALGPAADHALYRCEQFGTAAVAMPRRPAGMRSIEIAVDDFLGRDDMCRDLQAIIEARVAEKTACFCAEGGQRFV